MSTDFDRFKSRIVISGSLQTQGPLRIGTGKSSSAVESDQPVLKDVRGRPVIPGSSLKGAIRSFLEQTARGLVVQTTSDEHMKWVACDPLQTPCINPNAYGEQSDDIKRNAFVETNTCIICRVFGSPAAASKLTIRDSAVDTDFWGGQYLVRDGVSINRDTGTAEAQRKYDFEVVPAGVRFYFKMELENTEPFEQGLVFIALRALQNERIQFGGAQSRGLGWVVLLDQEVTGYENPIDYALEENGISIDDDMQRAAIDAFNYEIKGRASSDV